MDSIEPEMTPERTDAIRGLLLNTLRNEPARRVQRQRQRVLIWVSAFVVVTGVATTGATVLLQERSVDNTAIVHCYSSTSQNADGTYPGSSATIADGNGRGQARDALALCTAMWEQGVFETGFDPTTFDPTAPTSEPGAVPELQVCVLADGSAAVVPGKSASVCQTVGLAPLVA